MDSDSFFLKIICSPFFHSKGVKNICDFSQEPDGAMMLQSHSNSFFRDVVEKVMDSSEECSSSYWDVGGATDPVPWMSHFPAGLFVGRAPGSFCS